MMDSVHPGRPNQPHPALLWIGAPLILMTGLLAWRVVWEETSLSLEHGPQMIGFSLAHGPLAMFLLAPMALMFWFVPAMITIGASLWRRKPLSNLFWAMLSLGIAAIGILSLPPAFWQCVLIDRFARSPHVVEFMTEDAAEGYTRTVAAYLDRGIPIDARGEYGTAANAAARGGSVEVLKLLQSRHADLNAKDSSGKSPLTDAMEMKQAAAIAYLRSQGTLEIHPPPPPANPPDVIVTP